MSTTERLTTALAGRYRLERHLGEGGMATVYLAEDLKHKRKVALKVLRPELAAILGGERFLKEIELTANLQHPNILPLYDSGEADTFLYYVMPFVEGESLRDKLNRERQLGVDEALDITKSVAAALQYAHERNVVHRDIKPENILIQAGQALVADFGIALAVTQAGGTRLTQTGLSLGTPAYMSPEQATGDRVLDARSDIYSLGCMTYEMLVGEPPHVGNSVQAIIAKILSERPAPVSQTRDLVPPNVDAAVQKALAKSPADRFRTAAEYAAALANAQFALPTMAISGAVATASTRRSWKDRLAVPLAVLTGLLLVAAIWGWLRPGPPPAQLVKVPVMLPDSAPLQQQFGILFALSDDGTRLVYAGPGESDILLWVRRMDELTATPLPGTEGADSPFLSPDGETVAFYRNTPNALFTASLRGGPRETLVPDSMRSLGGDWGPDGSIYFTRRGGIRRRRPDGTIEAVTQLDTTRGEVAHAWVDVLPGGRGALFTIERSTQLESDVAVVDFASHEVRPIVRGVYARYSPSGHVVYATSNSGLYAVPFDEDALATRGTAVPLASNVAVADEGAAHFSISANGTLLYGLGGQTGANQLEWVDRTGAVQRVDTVLKGSFADLALSPDFRTLAVAVRDGAGWNIWTKDLANGVTSRLSLDGTLNYGPGWLPDGRSVTFTSGGASRADAFRARRLDGSAPATTLFSVAEGVSYGFISRDGSWFIYQTDLTGTSGGTRRDIFARRTAGDTARIALAASDANEMAPRLSPDGKWLAYVSDESGPATVYVSPFPNTTASRTQVSVAGGSEPLWSPDGRELFYLSSPESDLVAARVETGEVLRVIDRTTLFNRSAYNRSVPDGPLYAVTADGKQFIMSRNRGESSERLVLVLNWAEELRSVAK